MAEENSAIQLYNTRDEPNQEVIQIEDQGALSFQNEIRQIHDQVIQETLSS